MSEVPQDPVSSDPRHDLERRMREHWARYSPAKTASLKAAGQLDAAIAETAARTLAAVDELLDRGLNLWEAWELVRGWPFPTEEGGVFDDDEAAEHPAFDALYGEVDEDEFFDWEAFEAEPDDGDDEMLDVPEEGTE